MKKRSLVALSLACLLAFVVSFSSSASAQIMTSKPTMSSNARARPAATDCINGNCDARSTYQTKNAYWEGESTDFEVSNPSFSSNGVSYFREIYMEGGVSALAEVGIVKWKRAGCGGTCSNNTSLQYFFDVYNSNGIQLQAGCAIVPSSEYNKQVEFRMGFYLTNGPGMYFEVINGGLASFSGCANPCFVKGAMTSYTLLGMQEDIVDDVSGHQVWGVYWQNNQFQSPLNGGNPWQYFGAASTPSAPNPVQMYWSTIPQGSANNGGTLSSCVYETGSTCTYGSFPVKPTKRKHVR